MRLLKIMPIDFKLSASSLKRCISREIKKTPKVNSEAIQRAVTSFSGSVTEFIHVHNFLYSWMSVMLVTFVEAYMEENLELIARKNPTLLKNADPVSLDVIFESDSLEDLKAELRQQWAKRTLRGGPEKWLKRIQEMGARGYEKDCCLRMQHLWDTRNLIVHAQGVINKGYHKKYSNQKLKVGDRVHVAGNLFSWWLDGLKVFLEPTDQFFFRYAAGAAEAES